MLNWILIYYGALLYHCHHHILLSMHIATYVPSPWISDIQLASSRSYLSFCYVMLLTSVSYWIIQALQTIHTSSLKEFRLGHCIEWLGCRHPVAQWRALLEYKIASTYCNLNITTEFATQIEPQTNDYQKRRTSSRVGIPGRLSSSNIIECRKLFVFCLSFWG